MGTYQLFFQKNSTIFFLIVLCAFRFTSAAPVAKEVVSNEVLKSIPERSAKLLKNHKYIWAEYCPDNTCDAVRSKSKVSTKHFGDLAAAYYYFFSKYEYLEKWQTDPAVAKLIDKNLKLINDGACLGLGGKNLVRCRLKLLSTQSGLEIFFIRFDEGHRTKIVIPITEALQ